MHENLVECSEYGRNEPTTQEKGNIPGLKASGKCLSNNMQEYENEQTFPLAALAAGITLAYSTVTLIHIHIQIKRNTFR